MNSLVSFVYQTLNIKDVSSLLPGKVFNKCMVDEKVYLRLYSFIWANSNGIPGIWLHASKEK